MLVNLVFNKKYSWIFMKSIFLGIISVTALLHINHTYWTR